MFENRVLKKTAGPKWEDVSVEWSEQYDDDLRDLYSLRNFVRVNKTRRWDGWRQEKSLEGVVWKT